MYTVLLCDAPWSYADKARAGERGAEYKYPCMSMDDLGRMRGYIDEIVAPDSVLFMWATAPMLPNAFILMDWWGYKYKTIAFTWIKTNKNGINHCMDIGNPLMLATYITAHGDMFTYGDFMGMGHHTRSNAEFVLLGIRGKGLKRVDASVRSTVISPIREHSRKPDEVKERIKLLYGEQRRLELFSREPFPGFNQHGNETGKFKSSA